MMCLILPCLQVNASEKLNHYGLEVHRFSLAD